MTVNQIIKRVAYSIVAINPSIASFSNYKNVDAMPLWVAIVLCLFMFIMILIIAVALITRIM